MKTQGVPYSKDSECNLSAERVVLATIFREQDIESIARLKEADFVDHLHSLMLVAFKDLVKRGAPLEIHALQPLLRTPEYEQHSRKCGVGREYSLATAVALELDEFSNPANLEYYIRQLRTDRARRWLLRFADNIKKKVRGKPMDPLDILRWVEKRSGEIIKESGLEVECDINRKNADN